MLPPAPKQVSEVSAGQKVIDDEEFEAKLAAIIERDYFPDVKRLQNRLEWSEAAESNDPDQMANAQRNIVLRRAGFSVPLKAELPAATSDPTPTPTRSTSHSNITPSPSPSPAPSNAAGAKSQPLPEGAILPPSVPLQRFAAAHNTEDHASMEDIVSADNARRRVRYAWAYEESDRTNADMLANGHQPPLLTACNASAEAPAPQVTGRPTALLISLPDDGGGTANATLARRARRMLAPRTAGSVGGGLQTTPPKHQGPKPAAAGLHAPKSALYYPPSGNLPLSSAERQQMAAGAPPVTVTANTRFRATPSAGASDGGSSAAASPSTMAGTPTSALSSRDSAGPPSPMRADGGGAAALEAQIGHGAPRHGVATPSPSPGGAGGAPPMTWGEVGATPMVLAGDGGGSRTPGGALPTLRSVKEAAADKARREMAASRARDHQRVTMLQQQQQAARRAGAAMSPAARRLTKRLQGSSSWAHIDAQLRATYGHRTPGSTVRDAPLATPTASPSAAASPAAAGLLGEMTPERRHS